MSFVALDLSIRSTGWAAWTAGQALPSYGIWNLASHIDHSPKAFVRLHQSLLELHKQDPIESLVFEEPIPPGQLQGHTNIETIVGAVGLATHAMSFAEALGIRKRAIPITAWRRNFFGSIPRGTKSADLKHMAMTKCRELGFEPSKHDAAEALGILDYQLLVEGVLAPWRKTHVLERDLAGERRCA